MNDKKTSVRTLTMLALLVAMSIVFSRVLSISTGFVRFNLGSLPVLLAALLFGPGAGFAVGAVADIIGGVLAGYAINPLITLGAGAIGLVAGFAWQKLPAFPHKSAACSQRAAGALCGLHGHHLAGAAPLLRLPVGNAGGAHPQCPHPERGEHCAAAHPAGEPQPDEAGKEVNENEELTNGCACAAPEPEGENGYSLLSMGTKNDCGRFPLTCSR